MTLQTISPILWTKDLKATVSFYENILGFKSQSNFPNFVSLNRDGVTIMFVVPLDEPADCNDENDKVNFFTKPTLTGSIFITMKQVDTFWDSVKDKATIKAPLADREYLMRDFSILDNNGYELVFAQDISK
ncbi:MAG: VOC family protein [Chitinophagaceae bacterium]|uniref:VOC family protein n=1 Tax=unclassified Paraflavitalea TaxID=2798305 RepID=UPI003D331511|nr:VOC family protein [Chitinophagaceae bacterium]